MKYFLQVLVCVAFVTQSYGQGGIDSVKLEKNRLAAQSLQNTISEQKVKLSEMEQKMRGMVEKKSDENEDAQDQADQNSRMSDRLSDDPTNKRLNRKANRTARQARSQAKTARKQANSNKQMEKDIRKLKSKIEDNEHKLAKYSL